MKKDERETAIKKYRKGLHITQQQMAKLLHIKQPSYSILEKNGIDKLSTAKRHAAKLGCKASQIMDLDD